MVFLSMIELTAYKDFQIQDGRMNLGQENMYQHKTDVVQELKKHLMANRLAL